MYSPEDFRDILINDTYLFPLYPSSMLLATNIRLTLHTPFPYFILPSLLRMSYDQYLHGGFGPFVFGPSFKSATGSMKFSVSVRNSNMMITIPGTQLIGYLCDIVPQHQIEPKRNMRKKRFIRDESKNTKDAPVINRFSEWISLRKQEGANDFADHSQRTIFPSSTLVAYSLGQVETFDNTTVDYARLKTDTVN